MLKRLEHSEVFARDAWVAFTLIFGNSEGREKRFETQLDVITSDFQIF